MSPTVTSAPESELETAPKVIDPKIKARRVAVKRAEGRRRLRWLLGTVAVLTVAGGACLVSLSSLLDVDGIDVIGSEHTPVPTVGQVSRIQRGQPLLWIHRDRVARRIEALPWVAHASVGLALPGRLRITVEERVPVATAARADGSFAALDTTGRVLTITPTRTPGLPEITGAGAPPAPGGSHRATASALHALTALPADLRARVTFVDLAGGLTFRFNTGPEARLGSTSGLAAKVAALHAVLADLDARRESASYVDVRVASAPVVG